MAPTYQGPLSTTKSRHVAGTFCKNTGLIFLLQASYLNPLRFIVGIDMTRISCFKHEQEILLFSQTLPIKSTKTFADDDEVLVDLLMFSVKSTKEQITDKAEFFRKIGVRFKMHWGSLINKHRIFGEVTDNGETTVGKRLVRDLSMEWLPFFQQIGLLASSGTAIFFDI